MGSLELTKDPPETQPYSQMDGHTGGQTGRGESARLLPPAGAPQDLPSSITPLSIP